MKTLRRVSAAADRLCWVKHTMQGMGAEGNKRNRISWFPQFQVSY